MGQSEIVTSTLTIEDLGLVRLMQEQPALRLLPPREGPYILEGEFRLHARYGERTIEDGFHLQLRVWDDPTQRMPEVRDLGNRIPRDFHQFEDRSFCLGSPTRIRDVLLSPEPVWRYVEMLLVPYLYAYAHLERYGTLPFGELEHGPPGLIDDYKRMFGFDGDAACIAALRLLALKKRIANKRPCPCGSGRRLGRCHNRMLNRWRNRHGRQWFATQLRAIGEQSRARPPKRLAMPRPPPRENRRLAG